MGIPMPSPTFAPVDNAGPIVTVMVEVFVDDGLDCSVVVMEEG